VSNPAFSKVGEEQQPAHRLQPSPGALPFSFSRITAQATESHNHYQNARSPAASPRERQNRVAQSPFTKRLGSIFEGELSSEQPRQLSSELPEP